ncbi:MAG: UbiA family prenyltransferase [Pseudomonadota bacterium]
MQEQDIALVVDLDGTLSRTDTLHEALLALVTSDPAKLLKLPGRLGKGKAAFKADVADIGVIDPAELPLNEAVLESLRVARDAGRKTALVSAADHRQVTAVAEAVGLFDEAYGTAEGRNLKGAEKAAFLTAHYGAGRFDYFGDSKADLPVWEAARQAVTVEASPSLRQAAEAVNANTRHISPPQGRARSMLRAMRPHQWSKNALLLLPMLAAHDFSNLVAVILGIVAFCLTASAVYVINDLIDLGSDRAHPRKRKRPFASGALTATTGAAMAGGLLGLALIFGLMTGNALFLAVLLAYLVATFAYSLWLKSKLIVDILMLASLYTVRIIAGGVAASVVLSPWLLGFSMFLFLALAAVKRQAELTDQVASGFENKARAYQVDDLPILRSIALSASQAAVLVLALYISSDNVQLLYPTPEILWLICPLLLYWLLRMVMKAHRGQMPDDPIVFAFTDSVCIAIVILCASITVAAAL